MVSKFVNGFVGECFDKGMTEKQAAATLDAYMEKRALSPTALARALTDVAHGLRGTATLGKGLGQLGWAGLKGGYKLLPHTWLPNNQGGWKGLLMTGEAGLGAYGLNEMGKSRTPFGDWLHSNFGAGDWFGGGRGIDPRALGSNPGYSGDGGSSSSSEDYWGGRGAEITRFNDPLDYNRKPETKPSTPSTDNSSSGTQEPVNRVSLLDSADDTAYKDAYGRREEARKKLEELRAKIDTETDPAIRESYGLAQSQLEREIAGYTDTIGRMADKNDTLLEQQRRAYSENDTAARRNLDSTVREQSEMQGIKERYNNSKLTSPSTWGALIGGLFSRATNNRQWNMSASDWLDAARMAKDRADAAARAREQVDANRGLLR